MPDPFLRPSFPLANRLRRAMWGVAYFLFFRPSPRPLHGWRNLILRLFGAQLGPNTHIYPKARIWAPWNLVCDELASIADDAIIYNPQLIHLGVRAIVSQQAYLCGATHDYEDPEFPLLSYPITLGASSWICARATVQAGVNVGEGAILALGSVATHNLEPWTIYGGIPARKIKARIVRHEPALAHATHA